MKKSVIVRGATISAASLALCTAGMGVAYADDGGVPAPNIVGDYAPGAGATGGSGAGGGSAPEVPDSGGSTSGDSGSVSQAPAVPEQSIPAPDIATPSTGGGSDTTGGSGGSSYAPDVPEIVEPDVGVDPTPSGPSEQQLNEQRDTSVRSGNALAWTGYQGTNIDLLKEFNNASNVSWGAGALAMALLGTVMATSSRRRRQREAVVATSIPGVTAPSPRYRVRATVPSGDGEGGKHRKKD